MDDAAWSKLFSAGSETDCKNEEKRFYSRNRKTRKTLLVLAHRKRKWNRACRLCSQRAFYCNPNNFITQP